MFAAECGSLSRIGGVRRLFDDLGCCEKEDCARVGWTCDWG